ncbi:lanthionine synthetase LanC family protein [Kribbella sp. VKM Ac-2568]|uniref:lanthionine synthetase LanC family protein n=1 Tax=Kribbella sp. VKM Ac-2568 TaxID=2512219 RepID=UPI00130516FF|nr:lanthionine synthetase LanC family protein [Kribbella sp. VKM Ac-2568]
MALGPDLYAGTAGIGLFLAELFAKTRLEEVGMTARGAIQHALWKANDPHGDLREGFYNGSVGIAYAATRVGILTDDERLVNAGIRLASRAASSRGNSNLLDVMSGNAGVVAPLLRLASLAGDQRLQERTIALAEELATTASKADGAWSWENDRACGPGAGPTPLCGFAHGASGIGLALIETGAHSSRHDLIEGGLAAFAYEDRLYDREHENWPDLRELRSQSDDPRAPVQARFMIAWCHGAAGIGLARLRASRLLPEHGATLQLGTERAINATLKYLQALPEDVDASPCHGRAGVAETLLYTTEVLGNPSYTEKVVKMWNLLVGAHEPDAPWPCGVASGRNSPSLMLGYAGIGYGLLRAVDPYSTPSVLVIDAELVRSA